MSRHWSVTLNNYEEEDQETLFKKYPNATCITVGFEKGEEGTPHLQAAFSVKNITEFATVKKKLGDRWHIERAKGTPQELHSYCMKGESQKWNKKDPDSIMWQHTCPGENWAGKFTGTFPAGQGNDERFTELCKDVREGRVTIEDIKKTDPMMFHQYGRTLLEMEATFMQSQFRSWMTEGLWLTGEGGCGKSHAAFLGFDPKQSYVWKDDNGWQDGYKGQPIIIMNDFRGSTMKFNELMELVDKYPHEIRRRGKCPTPNLARLVIITSVLKPKEAYKYCLKELTNWKQFERRFEIMCSCNLAEDMVLRDTMRLRARWLSTG